jgi:hypothetical protein
MSILPFRLLFPLLCLSLLFHCNDSTNTSDNFLFGLSERYDRFVGNSTTEAEAASSTTPSVATPTCTSDVTVSTKVVSISEDGDVNATFSTTTDNGLSETDTDGGTSWGYRSF